jgi:hypothetical protein
MRDLSPCELEDFPSPGPPPPQPGRKSCRHGRRIDDINTRLLDLQKQLDSLEQLRRIRTAQARSSPEHDTHDDRIGIFSVRGELAGGVMQVIVEQMLRLQVLKRLVEVLLAGARDVVHYLP